MRDKRCPTCSDHVCQSTERVLPVNIADRNGAAPEKLRSTAG